MTQENEVEGALIVNIARACEMIGCSRYVFRKMLDAGDLEPAIRGVKLYRVKDIRAILEGKKSGS